MEKVQLSKCFAAMNTGIPSKLVGVNNGVSVLATPGEVSELSGCGTIPIVTMFTGKWYRIATGNIFNMSPTTLVNITKVFNTSLPSSQLFYINADGYSGSQNVRNIYSSNKSISKMRILYKAESAAKVFVDAYINTADRDQYLFAYACNIGFKFQIPVEVPNTPDEGYSVKEFVF